MRRSNDDIKKYLLAKDKQLKPVIQATAFPVFKRNRDVYTRLLSSIVSQQLSIKAADTIYRRFLGLFPHDYPDPEQIQELTLSKLRSAGLSKQKSAYIKNVADFALEHGVVYEELQKKTDIEVVEYLTQIKGVGRWTVEMLLMSSLNRKDIFAVDDLGIQQAMQALYKLDTVKKQLREDMLNISSNWQPYRTIVCKYLWSWRR